MFGGDEREVERRDLRPESSLSSSSSSSSAAVAAATGAVNLWSKSNKRRPVSTNSTVLTIAAGHARADSAASLAEVTNIIDDDRITRKVNDDDDADDDDDRDDDTKDVNDDRHNNNGNIGNNRQDSNDEDIACGYGVNNNDNDDNDEDGDNDDDDDNNDDDNLNNRHFRQQRRHRPDEVSPAKHNLLSPATPAGGSGSGLISDVSSLDLLTNHATNTRNELLINNNARNKVTEGEEEDEIATSNKVTHGADSIPSIVTFLQNNYTYDRDISEDGEKEKDDSSDTFGGAPPIDSVAGRPSVTHGDDPSVPSTSRRTDQSALFPNTGHQTSSPTNPSTAHQSIYRSVNEQYVSAFVNETFRLVQGRLHLYFVRIYPFFSVNFLY